MKRYNIEVLSEWGTVEEARVIECENINIAKRIAKRIAAMYEGYAVINGTIKAYPKYVF